MHYIICLLSELERVRTKAGSPDHPLYPVFFWFRSIMEQPVFGLPILEKFTQIFTLKALSRKKSEIHFTSLVLTPLADVRIADEHRLSAHHLCLGFFMGHCFNSNKCALSRKPARRRHHHLHFFSISSKGYWSYKMEQTQKMWRLVEIQTWMVGWGGVEDVCTYVSR